MSTTDTATGLSRRDFLKGVGIAGVGSFARPSVVTAEISRLGIIANFAVSVVRPQDQLHFTVKGYSLQLASVLLSRWRILEVIPNASLPLLALEFPPQHIAEQSFDWGATLTHPPWSAMSACSRWAFPLPPNARHTKALVGKPFSLETLLKWLCDFSDVMQAFDDPVLLPPDGRIPTYRDSFLEVPSYQYLAFNRRYPQRWRHRVRPPRSGTTELWHTSLALGPAIGLQAPPFSTANWAQERPDDGSRLRNALLAPIVGEAQNPYGILRPIGRRPDPGPRDTYPFNHTTRGELIAQKEGMGIGVLRAEHLSLTSAGAIAALHYRADPLQMELVRDDFLVEWLQLIHQGRDQFVRVVKAGYLLPFQHRAVVVEIGQRRPIKVDGTAAPAAAMQLRKFVLVLETIREFPSAAQDGPGNTAVAGRLSGLRKVEIATLQSPDLDHNWTDGFLVPADTAAFGARYSFRVKLTDNTNTTVEGNAPLYFVRHGHLDPGDPKVIAYNAATERERAVTVDNGTITVVPPRTNGHISSSEFARATIAKAFPSDSPGPKAGPSVVRAIDRCISNLESASTPPWIRTLASRMREAWKDVDTSKPNTLAVACNRLAVAFNTTCEAKEQSLGAAVRAIEGDLRRQLDRLSQSSTAEVAAAREKFKRLLGEGEFVHRRLEDEAALLRRRVLDLEAGVKNTLWREDYAADIARHFSHQVEATAVVGALQLQVQGVVKDLLAIPFSSAADTLNTLQDLAENPAAELPKQWRKQWSQALKDLPNPPGELQDALDAFGTAANKWLADLEVGAEAVDDSQRHLQATVARLNRALQGKGSDSLTALRRWVERPGAALEESWRDAVARLASLQDGQAAGVRALQQRLMTRLQVYASRWLENQPTAFLPLGKNSIEYLCQMVGASDFFGEATRSVVALWQKDIAAVIEVCDRLRYQADEDKVRVLRQIAFGLPLPAEDQSAIVRALEAGKLEAAGQVIQGALSAALEGQLVNVKRTCASWIERQVPGVKASLDEAFGISATLAWIEAERTEAANRLLEATTALAELRDEVQAGAQAQVAAMRAVVADEAIAVRQRFSAAISAEQSRLSAALGLPAEQQQLQDAFADLQRQKDIVESQLKLAREPGAAAVAAANEMRDYLTAQVNVVDYYRRKLPTIKPACVLQSIVFGNLAAGSPLSQMMEEGRWRTAPQWIAAQVKVPDLDRFSTAAKDRFIKPVEGFVTNGLATWDAARSQIRGQLGDTYAQFRNAFDQGVDQVIERAGDALKTGVADLSLGFGGLSREIGSVAGNINLLAKVAEGNIADVTDQVQQLIKDIKLFGTLTLDRLLAEFHLGAMPNVVTQRIGGVEEITWRCQLPMKSADFGFLSVKVDDNSRFSLEAKSRVPLLNPSGTTHAIEGHLPGGVQLEIAQVLWIKFRNLSFRQSSDSGFHVDPGIIDMVTFDGNLKYLGELADFISRFTSNLPTLRMQDGVLFWVKDIAMPDIAFGAFAITDVSIVSRIGLPLRTGSLAFGIGFCSEEKPFKVFVGGYVGEGYCEVYGDAGKGVTSLNASFGFGGGTAFSLGGGIAVGSGSVVAGIRISITQRSSRLSGFVHAAGHLRVLGFIHFGLNAILLLTYDNGDAVGIATFTVTYSIGIWDMSVSFSYETTFAGKGTSSEAMPLAIDDGGTSFASSDEPSSPLHLWRHEEEFNGYWSAFSFA